MNPLKKMKAELKALALEIRQKRQTTKINQRSWSFWYNANPGLDYRDPKRLEGDKFLSGIDQWGLVCKAAEFRIKFVAYCLLRGRKYEEIEPRVRDGNEIDMERVEKIMKVVENEFEALRASESGLVA